MRHPFYLVEQGSTLRKTGRRLRVTRDDQTLAYLPVLQVSQVVIFGNIQVTTPALKLLLNEDIEVIFLSIHGRFYGRLIGPSTGNGALRVAQVLHSRNPRFALATAQKMVRGKIHNIKVFLQRYSRRLDSPPIQSAASRVDELLKRVPRTTTINSLMGVEGQATAIYFGVWKNLLQPPWGFVKRVRRPPTDPVNVLLSFGYTLLQQEVLSAVMTAGLDPYVGFLHQLSYNRPSLALDLMEEFRPLIADSVVLRCLNNKILTPADFVSGNAERPIILREEGVKRFIREIETRLTQTFKHPKSGERITYRRLFLLQAYQLASTLNLTGLDEGQTPNDAHSPPADAYYQPFLAR